MLTPIKQRVWFFEILVYTAAPNLLHAVQTELVRANWDHWPGEILTVEDARKHGLIVNTRTFHGLTSIDRWLLVTSDVLARLASRCTRLQSIARMSSVTDAFAYDVRPNDLSFLYDDAHGASSDPVDVIAHRFASKYRCPIPSCQYAILELINGDEQSTLPADVVEVIAPVLPNASSLENRCRVSPRFVRDHGIVWSKGFWCTDELWQIIRPLLDHPAWYFRSYEL